MLCPSCLSPMQDKYGILGSPEKSHIDLYCSANINMFPRFYIQEERICRSQSHIGISIDFAKKSLCYRYDFSLLYLDTTYYLSGYDYSMNPSMSPFLFDSKTELFNYVNGAKNELISINFVPLSTGDDMHQEAWKLFHRMYDLIILA